MPIKKSRASSSEDARKYRQSGHDDALKFALAIGLNKDYQNDAHARSSDVGKGSQVYNSLLNLASTATRRTARPSSAWRGNDRLLRNRHLSHKDGMQCWDAVPQRLSAWSRLCVHHWQAIQEAGQRYLQHDLAYSALSLREL